MNYTADKPIPLWKELLAALPIAVISIVLLAAVVFLGDV